MIGLSVSSYYYKPKIDPKVKAITDLDLRDKIETIQAEFPEGVTRLLLPSHHMNVFTDSSLASLLVRSGYRPIAAWYFGMDVFEALMQVALALDDKRVLLELKSAIPSLQRACDGALLCDDIVMAAVPL